jgi:hypothetical protein
MSMDEDYMQARMALNNAMEEFIHQAYRVGFPRYKIADDIVDSIYDADSDIHRYAQRSLMPMVEKFHKSDALISEEIIADWEKAVIKWDQMQMWKVMNG